MNPSPHWSEVASRAAQPSSAAQQPTTMPAPAAVALPGVRVVLANENYWWIRGALEVFAAALLAAGPSLGSDRSIAVAVCALLLLALVLSRQLFVVDQRAQTLSLARVTAWWRTIQIPFAQVQVRSVSKTTHVQYTRNGRNAGNSTRHDELLELSRNVSIYPENHGYGRELNALLSTACGKLPLSGPFFEAVASQRRRAFARLALSLLSLLVVLGAIAARAAEGDAPSLLVAAETLVLSVPFWLVLASRVARVLEQAPLVAIGQAKPNPLRWAAVLVAALVVAGGVAVLESQRTAAADQVRAGIMRGYRSR
ncbi:MAG: hypothetical protein U0269_36240 [Polyangiales bacterium]